MPEYIESNPFECMAEEGIPSQTGIMLYELVSPDKEKWDFAFFVKEETQYINRHRKNPIIQLKMGILRFNNVVVIPIMMLFGNDPDMLYESTFNYHQDRGRLLIETLSKQDRIHIFFCNERNETVRQVELINNIKDDILEISLRMQHTQPWSMEEFDFAKLKMYNMFPSSTYLWNKLSTQ